MIILKYLTRQVLVAMFSVTLVLLLVFMSARFIRYLEQATVGNISAEILFPIMAYRTPEFLQMILPLSFFIGILLAYGRMYMDSEMTVLHSCGLSLHRLLGMSLFASLLVMIPVGVMSLWLSPWGFQGAKQLLLDQSRMTEFELLVPGRFQRLRSGDRVTYVGAISEDKKFLKNVFIAEGENNALIYAEKGTLETEESTGDRFLKLHNGFRYQGVAGQRDYQKLTFDSYGIRIADQEPKDRIDSYEIISKPTQTLLNSSDLASVAELQWRISLPLLLPVLCILAVSICRVNPRQGRFVYLLPAMLIYIIYLGLLSYARNQIERGLWSPAIGLWGIHALFLMISTALVAREKVFGWFSRLRQEHSMAASNKTSI